MLIHVVQEMVSSLPTLTAMLDPAALGDMWQSWLGHSTIAPDLLAQFNQNVFSRFNVALDNFIKTGQVWALLIGLIVGYLVRGFTSYG
jgi:hypothetical protein